MKQLKKSAPKTYTVTITEEQIALIRNLSMRLEILWTHPESTKLLGEDGVVEFVSLYRCDFCGRGSYESAGAIIHEKKCIVPLHDREFETLNAQFIAVLSGEED